METKTPLDCSAVNTVDGFVIEKAIPAGSSLRVAFRVDGNVVKITGQTLTNLPTQSYTTESILSEGNTVEELEALATVPAFVDKQVYPIIALLCPPDTKEIPHLSLKIRGTTVEDVKTKTEVSQIYKLSASPVEILGIKDSTAVEENASCTLAVSLDGGEYIPLEQARGQKAQTVQFRAVYSVDFVGAGSAKVNFIKIKYKSSEAVVSGEIAEIVTTTQDFQGVGMRFGRVMLKHSNSKDGIFSVQVSMRNTPKEREMIPVGIGNGKEQTLLLKPENKIGADKNINHNTLHVFHGSQEIYDADFNTELSQITTTAENGVTIFASYQYDWEPEQWREMTQGTTQTYSDNLKSTEYSYAVPYGDVGKSIATTKIILQKKTGRVEKEALALGTGKKQMLVLEHFARPSSIELFASVGSVQFSYEEESKILTIVAEKGAEIQISYDWVSESPEIRSFVSCFNE